MQVKLQWDITSHWSEWLSSKSPQAINAGESVEKREHSYTVGGSINWYSHYEEQYGGSLKNCNFHVIQHSHSWSYTWRKSVSKDTCTSVLITALFTTASTWKQPKCPLTEEWIKKMWYIYAMEYYSAITRNKTVRFAEMWMALETVIQSKVNQKEKNKYRIILLVYAI